MSENWAVVAYYAVAVIFLIVRHAVGLVGLPFVALLSWSVASTMALLPITARAVRRPTRRR